MHGDFVEKSVFDHASRTTTARKVTQIGIWGNVVLTVLKFSAGVLGHSSAMISDAVHSFSDILATGVVYFTIGIAAKPKDKEHPYGHGKAEALGAFTVGLILVGVGLTVLFESVKKIFIVTTPPIGILPVVAAAVSIVFKEWMFRYTHGIGKKINNRAIMANAYDHRSDVYTSFAALSGILMAKLGWPLFDPVAGAVIVLAIFRMSYKIIRSAALELMDTQLDVDLINRITRIAENVEGIEHVHQIKARRYGHYFLVDLKVDIDPQMTVLRSHDITARAKKRIFDEISTVGDVIIHVNPHDKPHKDLTRL